MYTKRYKFSEPNEHGTVSVIGTWYEKPAVFSKPNKWGTVALLKKSEPVDYIPEVDEKHGIES
ncbi:MAG: hypothetical protein FWC00_06015 [Firmicutes bacterium]|nr:hypothetical protein [Bacillota bacterium]